MFGIRHNIQDLAAKATLKVPGSTSHRKLFRHYLNCFVDDIQESLHRDINFTSHVNADATRGLESALGSIGANQGIMPDFSNKDALRGYALQHFGRARMLGDLMTRPDKPEWLGSRVAELFTGSSGSDEQQMGRDDLPPINMVSLGGGPGYDFVAAAALSEFRRGRDVRCKVFEYEKAWESIVASIERATQNLYAETKRHTCGFGRCDITLPISDVTNVDLARKVDIATEDTLYSCCYCINENAVALRQRNWVFFQDLFHNAIVGNLFLILDTSHRLWPDLATIAKDAGMYYSTPHVRYGKAGYHFVAYKGEKRPDALYYNTAISEDLLQRFKFDNEAHMGRLGRGWKRHERKIRGAK